ncbi:MAG: hypothetical protein ACRC28_02385 [Clostridium sp.]
MVTTNHKKYIQKLGIKLTFEGNIQSVVLKKTFESISLEKDEADEEEIEKELENLASSRRKFKEVQHERYDTRSETIIPRKTHNP